MKSYYLAITDDPSDASNLVSELFNTPEDAFAFTKQYNRWRKSRLLPEVDHKIFRADLVEMV